MGLSSVSLMGLQKFEPSSLVQTLQFFEFLKYDSKSFRSQDIIYRDELLESLKSNQKFKSSKNLKKTFDDYLTILH